jgi:hypothetical protein
VIRTDALVPTLTEVIELAVDPAPLDLALPGAAEEMALEDLALDDVMARLTPRVDGWIDGHVQAALDSLLPRLTAEMSQALAHELRGSLPTMLAQAFAEAAAARKTRGR